MFPIINSINNLIFVCLEDRRRGRKRLVVGENVDVVSDGADNDKEADCEKSSEASNSAIQQNRDSSESSTDFVFSSLLSHKYI